MLLPLSSSRARRELVDIRQAAMLLQVQTMPFASFSAQFKTVSLGRKLQGHTRMHGLSRTQCVVARCSMVES